MGRLQPAYRATAAQQALPVWPMSARTGHSRNCPSGSLAAGRGPATGVPCGECPPRLSTQSPSRLSSSRSAALIRCAPPRRSAGARARPPEQHLPVAPVEPAQFELGACQLQHLAVEPADLLDRHVDLPPPTVAPAPVTLGAPRAEPDDDIEKPPSDSPPGSVTGAEAVQTGAAGRAAACLWCRWPGCRHAWPL